MAIRASLLKKTPSVLLDVARFVPRRKLCKAKVFLIFVSLLIESVDRKCNMIKFIYLLPLAYLNAQV